MHFRLLRVNAKVLLISIEKTENDGQENRRGLYVLFWLFAMPFVLSKQVYSHLSDINVLSNLGDLAP